ncbi:PfkB family carbohydrate kinase (plasmid) [Streptomyces sp. NBC_01717]|uniref:PfkB family carbohydrate kinase n=1 Tax=Streptomyces sp. NBC_01717 TaxID=2975918 RepID=UPI002E348CE9|nr:PfkB family carbohydrate kinase [Streptomyces sp. NBC_01717]
MSRGDILVLGEALVDLVPVLEQAVGEPTLLHVQPGGGPANVAVGLGRLGMSPTLAGGLGEDAFARMLEERLDSAGVDLSLCVRSGLPTALAVSDSDGAGASYNCHFKETASFQLPDLRPTLSRFEAVYVGGLAAVVDPAARVVAATARAAARTSLLVVDPNVREFGMLEPVVCRGLLRGLVSLAHVVKASDEDLVRLWPGRDPEAIARTLARAGRLIVMTRGAHGSTAFTADAEPFSVGAAPMDVLNTIGAGDAFTAGMLSWLGTTGIRLGRSAAALTAREAEAMLNFASETAASVCGQVSAEPSGPART